jgi:hypothetical protein
MISDAMKSIVAPRKTSSDVNRVVAAGLAAGGTEGLMSTAGAGFVEGGAIETVMRVPPRIAQECSVFCGA